MIKKRPAPEDGEVGNDEHQGEDVALQLVAGFGPDDPPAPVVLPLSMTRLGAEQKSMLADVQDLVHRRAQMLRELDEIIVFCRAARIPWTAIGWSTGLTAQGAQQRWQDAARDFTAAHKPQRRAR